MNTGSGKNLDWFWKKWFFETGITDLAITKVIPSSKSTSVTITNKGDKPLPIDLKVEFTDGTSQTIHRSVAVWEKGNKTVTISISSNKKIKKLTLGSVHTPDSNKADNTWDAEKMRK
jgi:hypothetical protein